MHRKASIPVLPTIVTEETLRRTADIIGGNSGAAMALADIQRRRAAGEDSVCYRNGAFLVVGPRLEEPDDSLGPSMRI